MIIRPKIMAVSVYGDYSLLLSYSNGEQKVFDVRPYLDFEHFQELKNKDYFAMVQVSGPTIVWATGQNISPDELYYNSMPCFV